MLLNFSLKIIIVNFLTSLGCPCQIFKYSLRLIMYFCIICELNVFCNKKTYQQLLFLVMHAILIDACDIDKVNSCKLFIKIIYIQEKQHKIHVAFFLCNNFPMNESIHLLCIFYDDVKFYFPPK